MNLNSISIKINFGGNPVVEINNKIDIYFDVKLGQLE